MIEQPIYMNQKRTMTLNLTEPEMDALESMATGKDVSKTAVIRQALRLYQLVEERTRTGDKLFIEDEEGKAKSELMLL